MKPLVLMHVCVREGVIYLEVNPTEASLLYSEVWRDLQEARSVTFLLDSWALIRPLICP